MLYTVICTYSEYTFATIYPIYSESKSVAEMDFPDYDAFLNFFKNIVNTIQNTTDVYLIDQLVKLVFLNITVEDKKVLKYTLNEPFKTYKTLKFLSGVDDGN